MKTLKKKIYSSYFYNLILRFLEFMQKAYFLMPNQQGQHKQKVSYFSYTIGYKLWLLFDYQMEKIWLPIREHWEQSSIVEAVRRVGNKIVANSLLGKLFKEFNLVYLIALYSYVDYILRTYFAGISSYWDELLFIFIIGWIVFNRIIGNQRYKFTPIDLPIVFFALVQLFLLLINSPDLKVAIEGYRAVVQYIFWFFLVVQLIDHKKTLDRVLWILMIGVGLLGLHGIYQYATGAEMLGNWVDSGESIRTRVYSIVKSPNVLASVFILYIPVSFSVFLAEKDIFKKMIALGITLCMGFGLLFTFSRGAWISVFIGMLILFMFLAKRMIIPVSFFALGAVIYVEALWSRVYYLLTPEYTAKSAAGGRIYRWKIGIEEWSKHKAIGLGLGRYGGAVATNNNLTPFYMDNYYLKTLTETGIVGLASLLILLGLSLRQLFLMIQGTVSIKYRYIMFGLFSGLCSVITHNFVENIFESPFMVTYFWVNVAVIVSIYRLNNTSTNE